MMRSEITPSFHDPEAKHADTPGDALPSDASTPQQPPNPGEVQSDLVQQAGEDMRCLAAAIEALPEPSLGEPVQVTGLGKAAYTLEIMSGRADPEYDSGIQGAEVPEDQVSLQINAGSATHPPIMDRRLPPNISDPESTDESDEGEPQEQVMLPVEAEAPFAASSEESEELPLPATDDDGSDGGGSDPPSPGDLSAADDGEDGERMSDDELEATIEATGQELETAGRVTVVHRQMEDVSLTVVSYTGSPESSPKIAESLRSCDIVAIEGPYCETRAAQQELAQAYTKSLSSDRPDDEQEQPGVASSEPDSEGDISGTLSHLEGTDKSVVLLGATGEDDVWGTEFYRAALASQEESFAEVRPANETAGKVWQAVGIGAQVETGKDRVVMRQIKDLVDQTVAEEPYTEVGLVVDGGLKEFAQGLGEPVGHDQVDVFGLWGRPIEGPMFTHAIDALRHQEGEDAEEAVLKYTMARLMAQHMPQEYPSYEVAEKRITPIDPSLVEAALDGLTPYMLEVEHEPLEVRLEHARQAVPMVIRRYFEIEA